MGETNMKGEKLSTSEYKKQLDFTHTIKWQNHSRKPAVVIKAVHIHTYDQEILLLNISPKKSGYIFTRIFIVALHGNYPNVH